MKWDSNVFYSAIFILFIVKKVKLNVWQFTGRVINYACDVMWCVSTIMGFKCELPVPVLFFWDKVTDGNHKSKISSFFYACWTWKAWSLDNWNEKLKSSLFWFQWWGEKNVAFWSLQIGGEGVRWLHFPFNSVVDYCCRSMDVIMNGNES